MKTLTKAEAYRIVNRKELNAKRRAYYAENKEKELAVNDAYYQLHKEEIKAWRKVYIKAYRAKKAKEKALQQALINEKKQIRITLSPWIGSEGEVLQQSTK